MKKLLIATTNPGKLKEYKVLLKGFTFKLVSLKDLKVEKEAKEYGKTYKDNAIGKAKFYSKLTGLPALADDGGLEIDYLGREPGIRSRYWPGYRATDEELINLTLERLKNVPWNKRKAKLKIVLALVFPPKKIFTAEAQIKGFITTKPKKMIPGYPFRSIFYIPKLKKVYSELSFKKEVEIGHRKKAIKKLIPILIKEL
ncbi:MAG: non-canonical purine NTP pyrophosphatase [Minisyncoccia bacterium]